MGLMRNDRQAATLSLPSGCSSSPASGKDCLDRGGGDRPARGLRVTAEVSQWLVQLAFTVQLHSSSFQ